MKRWETLSSVYDQEEPDISREALGNPEGEGDELIVQPVFLTEDVLSRDPNLTPLSNRKDMEEWPQEKMIINIIENGDEMPRVVRSPSPGSKTYIPQDILAEFHGDLYGRNEMHIAGQKMIGKPNVAVQSRLSTEVPGYIAPAWRPPRSRTPIRFLETPSRKAPRPLRQPPAGSVPKSLTVQSLPGRALRRPKSTPPRFSSKDLPVQQILSDSSLVNSTRDDIDAYSTAAQASSPTIEASGSIPPPPSPEAQMIATIVPSAPRLDTVNEAEEKSSIASASVADGTSHVEGGNTVANLSEVEEENDEVELSQQSDKVQLEKEGETAAESTEEVTETAKTEENKDVAESSSSNSQPVGEESLSVKQLQPVSSETLQDEKQDLTKEDKGEIRSEETGNQEDESEKKRDEIPSEQNMAEEETRDNDQQEEQAEVPPHPPVSPDIVSTPDFTEGLDMNLDLDAELRAAMEGLEDFDDNTDGEGDEKRASPDLEAW